MQVFILVGIDPLKQPGVDEIYKFTTFAEAENHVRDWLYKTLTYQKTNLGGLKGNMIYHISNYMAHLKEHNYINFYGEYANIELHKQFEYKWSIFKM